MIRKKPAIIKGESKRIFEGVEGHLKRQPPGDLRRIIDSDSTWYDIITHMSPEERASAVAYAFNRSNQRKQELVNSALETIAGLGSKRRKVRNLFKQMFGLKPLRNAEVCLMVFDDNLHFLIDQDSYKTLRGELAHGWVVSEDKFSEESKRYAGTVTIGRIDHADYIDTAFHERYHALTECLPGMLNLTEQHNFVTENKERFAKQEPAMIDILRQFVLHLTYSELKADYHSIDDPDNIMEEMDDFFLKTGSRSLCLLYQEETRSGYSIIDKFSGGIIAEGKQLVQRGVAKFKALEAKGIPKARIQYATELCDYSEFPDQLDRFLK